MSTATTVCPTCKDRGFIFHPDPERYDLADCPDCPNCATCNDTGWIERDVYRVGPSGGSGGEDVPMRGPCGDCCAWEDGR